MLHKRGSGGRERSFNRFGVVVSGSLDGSGPTSVVDAGGRLTVVSLMWSPIIVVSEVLGQATIYIGHAFVVHMR